MAAFPAGSFAYLDRSMHHYAMASGEVVVQVTACLLCSSTASILTMIPVSASPK